MSLSIIIAIIITYFILFFLTCKALLDIMLLALYK